MPPVLHTINVKFVTFEFSNRMFPFIMYRSCVSTKVVKHFTGEVEIFLLKITIHYDYSKVLRMFFNSFFFKIKMKLKIRQITILILNNFMIYHRFIEISHLNQIISLVCLKLRFLEHRHM